MKIRTATNRQDANGDVLVGPTFTTGYRRDLALARRVIGLRKGRAKASKKQAPEHDRRHVGARFDARPVRG